MEGSRNVESALKAMVLIGLALFVAVFLAAFALEQGLIPPGKCTLPDGWKVVSNGNEYTWETPSGFQSVSSTYSSALKACVGAIEYKEFSDKVDSRKKEKWPAVPGKEFRR
jgi:hypothetical protein